MKKLLTLSLIFTTALATTLSAENTIKVETKIISSTENEIPHNIKQLLAQKGVDLMVFPEILTTNGKESKKEIIREHHPKNIGTATFDSLNTGITMTISAQKTELLDDNEISFQATIEITQIVDEKIENNKAQSQFQTQKIYLAGIQKSGEDGWFDLIDPKKDLADRKISILIKLTEQTEAPQI